MNKIKMVGIDLDGTALNSVKQISAENKRAFELCKKSSVLVVPVTGRPISGLYREYIEDFLSEYAICTNGAVAFRTSDKKELIHHGMNLEKVGQILEILNEFECHYELFSGGYGYVEAGQLEILMNRYNSPELHKYFHRTRKAVDSQADFLKSINHCDNIYVMAKSTAERERILKAVKKVDGTFVTYSDSDDVEIGGDCSKGGTLLELGELLGIDKSEIMAIGDSGNDLNMLEKAGFAVAMENASPAVRKAADYITLSCDDDGVAHAIKKFVL